MSSRVGADAHIRVVGTRRGGKNVNQRACLTAVTALKKEALPAIEARPARSRRFRRMSSSIAKVYADDTTAAKSRLFSIEVRSVALEEYASAS
jgi:hypothetical protein